MVHNEFVTEMSGLQRSTIFLGVKVFKILTILSTLILCFQKLYQFYLLQTS